MELQETTIRLSKMVETVIKRCISPRWKFPGGPNLLVLQDDIKVLNGIFGERVSEERVVDYVVYQIYRNRGTIEKGITWCPHFMFTDYAVDKFKRQFMSETGKSGINYYIDLWLNDGETSREELTAMIEKPRPNQIMKFIYMESEEITKQRFFNTECGYLLCQKSTTGWAPQSAVCNKCDYSKQCEQDTERKFPELVRLRREKYGKEQ